MPLFRARSPVIEAMQWDGENATEIRAWLGYAFVAFGTDDTILIENRDGRVTANLYDWIVRLREGRTCLPSSTSARPYRHLGRHRRRARCPKAKRDAFLRRERAGA